MPLVSGWGHKSRGRDNVRSIVKGASIALLGLTAAASWAECPVPSNAHWIVSIDESAMTISPKDREVCNGDVVTWVTNGVSPFRVIFPAGGMPGSPEQGDNYYSLTISGIRGKSYPYDVKIRGQSVDPSIIIRR